MEEVAQDGVHEANVDNPHPLCSWCYRAPLQSMDRLAAIKELYLGDIVPSNNGSCCIKSGLVVERRHLPQVDRLQDSWPANLWLM
jgi:hypothetical protein